MQLAFVFLLMLSDTPTLVPQRPSTQKAPARKSKSPTWSLVVIKPLGSAVSGPSEAKGEAQKKRKLIWPYASQEFELRASLFLQSLLGEQEVHCN